MATAAGDNMLNISILSNKQILDCITQLDADCGPVTAATRGVYERKLAKLRLSAVTGRRMSDTVDSGSPRRSTHVNSSMTESARTLAGVVDGNTSACSVQSKTERNGDENEIVISDLSFEEDEDNDDNVSFDFNVSRDNEVSTTTAHINSAARSAVKPSKEFNTKAASAAASALKTMQEDWSARSSAVDNARLDGEGKKVDYSGYLKESVDPGRNEQRQVMRDFNEENRNKERSGKNTTEMFADGVRYRPGGSEVFEGNMQGTNESDEWKYRSKVADRLARERNGRSESERERVGKENYDSFSSTYYSSTLTRPALESLTRPPLHPESKKIYDSESDEESFTMLSQHQLNDCVNQSVRDAPAVRSGMPFLLKIIIPVAVIIFIVCIISFLDPEFANPVKP